MYAWMMWNPSFQHLASLPPSLGWVTAAASGVARTWKKTWDTRKKALQGNINDSYTSLPIDLDHTSLLHEPSTSTTYYTKKLCIWSLCIWIMVNKICIDIYYGTGYASQSVENKSYLDLGLRVLLLMLLMVYNFLLLKPYLRSTLHLRLMDMCLEPLLEWPAGSK